MTPNLLCDNCIHNKVCGLQGEFTADMEFCVDQIPQETFGFIRRSNGLLLSDVAPYIKCGYFTVIVTTGETCNPDTYVNPAEYSVTTIDYDTSEQKVVIGVIPFKEH